jgi:hypothetical protein
LDHDNGRIRETPVVGHSYFAGTILSVDGRSGKHLSVTFQCAHCVQGIGRTRFSYLKADPRKRYQTKSCGWEKKACFERYVLAGCSELSDIKAMNVFASYCIEEQTQAAERHQISVYVASLPGTGDVRSWQHCTRPIAMTSTPPANAPGRRR